MKKLMRKLVLSCFALGLAVVTLTTTTFAWYTANASVSATGVQGTTAGEISGSLEISKQPNQGWGPTVEFTGTNEYTVDGTRMIPLQYSSASLVDLDNIAAVTSTGYGQYLQFVVYVRSSSELTEDTTVYLESLQITNTLSAASDNIKKAILDATYTENAWGANAKVGDLYGVDAVHALNFAIHGGAENTAGTIGSENYSIGEISDTVDDLDINLGTNFDALGYYNTLMEANKERPQNYETVVAEGTNFEPIEVLTIAESTTQAYAVTVTIWLDGWDKYCFDACQGQTFNVVLKLTTDFDDCTMGKPTTA